MQNLKRRYIYEETFNFIMEWGKKNKIHTPNNKPNFCYYLKKYVEHFNKIEQNMKENKKRCY